MDPILNIRTFSSAAPSQNYDEHVVRIGMTKLQWLQLRRLTSVARDNQLEYVSRHFPQGLSLQVTVNAGGHQRADFYQVKPKFVTSDGEEVRYEFVYLHIGPQEIWITYRSKDHDGPKWESDHMLVECIDDAFARVKPT